ncbi:hypothetical protein [Actinoplanes sp. NBRC 103695]|uniref:hypothetical protein n=1 Tax=Actinoplanes sp. NBRC 103695 TaxID=3032202 RepID=UPI002555CA9D|nr:hypothetical protein [Actinoplanes sp. NBRC 103695]
MKNGERLCSKLSSRRAGRTAQLRSDEALDDVVEGFRDVAVDAEVAAYGGIGQIDDDQ